MASVHGCKHRHRFQIMYSLFLYFGVPLYKYNVSAALLPKLLILSNSSGCEQVGFDPDLSECFCLDLPTDMTYIRHN